MLIIVKLKSLSLNSKFNVQKQIKYYQELLDLKMHEYFDVEEED